jgi:monoterpene epsilon-lactone hydrolase
MQTLLKAITRGFMRLLFKPVFGSRIPLGLQRRWFSLLARSAGRPKGVAEQELWTGETSTLRLRAEPEGMIGPAPPSERDAILFVHGGGFRFGDGSIYAGFAGRVAAFTGADVYLPNYRLAPEHPFPAPIDDLFAAYRGVLELGHPPSRIAVLGDSAGAALAVGLALTLPEMNVPPPAALVLFSPWLDLSLSGASITANARRDPMVSRRMLEAGGRAHAGDLRRSDPRVSPMFADLHGLPPMLIQVGSDEILLDDATGFADRAWGAGVEVELQRFEGWFHDFQSTAGTLRTAREALEDVSGFLARRFEAASSA